MKKRVIALMAAALCLMSIAVFPSDATAKLEQHCAQGRNIGLIEYKLTAELVGYYTENCIHGRVGGVDKVSTYRYFYSENCTLCSWQWSGYVGSSWTVRDCRP